MGAGLLASNRAFFSKILAATGGVQSVIEFGANIGMNIRALKDLLPGRDFAAIEINRKAADELEKIGDVDVYCQSLLDFDVDLQWDLTFTKGVLIHINPDMLGAVYDRLYRRSRRYVCVAEYYSASPTSIVYRGHQERLFKRDFAGELLERFDDLRLVDYGFSYRRDPMFPQGDITWFLMEKTTR